jgi:hypothetical protein
MAVPWYLITGAAAITATLSGGIAAASAARRAAYSPPLIPGVSSPGASRRGCVSGVGCPMLPRRRAEGSAAACAAAACAAAACVARRAAAAAAATRGGMRRVHTHTHAHAHATPRARGGAQAGARTAFARGGAVVVRARASARVRRTPFFFNSSSPPRPLRRLHAASLSRAAAARHSACALLQRGVRLRNSAAAARCALTALLLRALSCTGAGCAHRLATRTSPSCEAGACAFIRRGRAYGLFYVQQAALTRVCRTLSP